MTQWHDKDTYIITSDRVARIYYFHGLPAGSSIRMSTGSLRKPYFSAPGKPLRMERFESQVVYVENIRMTDQTTFPSNWILT